MNKSILNNKDIKTIAAKLKLELIPALKKLELDEEILTPMQKQSIEHYDLEIQTAINAEKRQALKIQREYWLQYYLLQNKRKLLK